MAKEKKNGLPTPFTPTHPRGPEETDHLRLQGRRPSRCSSKSGLAPQTRARASGARARPSPGPPARARPSRALSSCPTSPSGSPSPASRPSPPQSRGKALRTGLHTDRLPTWSSAPAERAHSAAGDVRGRESKRRRLEARRSHHTRRPYSSLSTN